jgi:hypothetical protein
MDNGKGDKFRGGIKMRKNNIVLWILATVVMFFVMVNTTGGEKQSQEAQYVEIERYISQLYQEIEDFYAVTFTEMELRAEAKIRGLEVAHQGVYASLSAQAELAKSVLLINNYEGEELRLFEDRDYRFGYTFKDSPERFALMQSRIAEEESRILNQYESQKIQLERNKRYAQNTGLAELKKRLKENVSAGKATLARGIVTGIVHSEDKPSAIIEGQIVYERDTIHRVRVVKIHRNKVDFIKGGQEWSQEVRETPASYWR